MWVTKLWLASKKSIGYEVYKLCKVFLNINCSRLRRRLVRYSNKINMCVISKILLVAEDNNNYILTRGNQEITNGEDEAEEEESLCTTTHCRLKCHGLGKGTYSSATRGYSCSLHWPPLTNLCAETKRNTYWRKCIKIDFIETISNIISWNTYQWCM